MLKPCSLKQARRSSKLARFSMKIAGRSFEIGGSWLFNIDLAYLYNFDFRRIQLAMGGES